MVTDRDCAQSGQLHWHCTDEPQPKELPKKKKEKKKRIHGLSHLSVVY